MRELLDRILDLPRPQRIALLIGMVLALLALDYFLIYEPRSGEIKRLSEEIENKRRDRDKKKLETSGLAGLREEQRRLEGMVKEAMAQLPDRKEIPDLLSGISSKAREAGLEIMVFRPRAENLQDFYAEVPVDIVVKGSFHNLGIFFDEVGRMNRLINISNITLRNPKLDGDRIELEASALATAFRFLDEGERARVAAQKKAAKR